MNAVVERLCALPRDLRVRSASPVELVEATGYFDLRTKLTREAVCDVLRRNTSLVDDWLCWSQDKRTVTRWVFKQVGSDYEVYHSELVGAQQVAPYTMRDGRHVITYRMTFSDRINACAEYVVREICSIARLAGKRKSE